MCLLLPWLRRRMITLQQYGRLQREYARSQNMSVSALNVNVTPSAC